MKISFMQKASVVLTVPFFSLISACNPSTQEKPNILFIVTDDQGYGDLSIHGNPYIETPNIDKLGNQSVRFDRFYVSSVCAPSRASLLTGRYNLRTGTFGVTHNKEAMNPEELTIPEILKTEGYYSSCIGKWHNGIQYPYNPLGQGFDEFFGFTGGHINNYFNAELLRGTKPEKTSGYITDVLTDEAIYFIKRNKNEPFFCYLSYNAPHGPWQVPDKYYEKFKTNGFDEIVSSIWGMCENIDYNVGRLIKCLDDEGITENTLIVFLSDNGGIGTTKLFNAGMKGGKTSVHEGGSRVPLFMNWPAANWTPKVVERISAHIDILPTIIDLCGIEFAGKFKLDGTSLKPLIEGDSEDWQDRTLFLHNPIDETNRYPGAVRTEKYRLVKKIKGPQAGSAAKNNDKSALPWELYDMKHDPGEENNIAEENPEIVVELSDKYENWLDDISSNELKRFPLPVGFDEHNPVTLFATQAYFSEPIKYFTGRGAANDWLTEWSNSKGKIWFDIEVAMDGEYLISIAYSCPEENAGSTIRLTAGNTKTETKVPPAPITEIPLPDRISSGYQSRVWETLKIGLVDLKVGRQKIFIEATSIPNGSVLDFKHLNLELKIN
jgi:arylsulfatase A-like enzyme